MIALPVLATVRWLATGRPIPQTPLNRSLALLALMLFVSILITPDPAFSLTKHVGLAYGIALYFAVFDAIPAVKQWRFGIFLFALAGGGLAAVGMLGVPFASYSKFPLLSRLTGQLPTVLVQGNPVNANMIGGMMTWILPVVLAFAIWAWREKRGRLITIIALLITAAMLITSQSRGAILGVGGALIWVLPLMLCGRAKWRLLLLGSSVASLLLIVVAALFLQNSDALLTRLELWDRALLLIADAPITGLGMNMYRRVMPLVYPLFLLSPTQDMAHAHNAWLTVAVDLGLPGLVAYCALLYGALRQAIGSVRRTAAPHHLLALGLLGSLIAHSLYSVWDAIALGAKPGFLFWVLLGLVMRGKWEG